MKRILLALAILLALSFPVLADVDIQRAGGGTSSGSSTRTEVDGHASGALSAANLSFTAIHNVTQTADVTLTLAPSFSGENFNVVLGITVAKYFRLDPNGTELIYLDGNSCGAGKYVGIASAVAGAAMSCVSFKTGASSYSLFCSAISGAFACEP